MRESDNTPISIRNLLTTRISVIIVCRCFLDLRRYYGDKSLPLSSSPLTSLNWKVAAQKLNTMIVEDFTDNYGAEASRASPISEVNPQLALTSLAGRQFTSVDMRLTLAQL